MFMQGLRKVYARFTQRALGLRKVYATFTQRLRKVYADGVLPTRARKPCVNQISQGLRKVYAQGNLLMLYLTYD
jgi:hypothetical protein